MDYCQKAFGFAELDLIWNFNFVDAKPVASMWNCCCWLIYLYFVDDLGSIEMKSKQNLVLCTQDQEYFTVSNGLEHHTRFDNVDFDFSYDQEQSRTWSNHFRCELCLVVSSLFVQQIPASQFKFHSEVEVAQFCCFFFFVNATVN